MEENSNYFIVGFLELFTKCIDELNNRAKPNGAFYAYAETVKVLSDVLINISIKNMPPALISSLAYNLNSVGYYVGQSFGKSYEAYNIWNSKKDQIPKGTLVELQNIAKIKSYFRLTSLIKKGYYA